MSPLQQWRRYTRARQGVCPGCKCLGPENDLVVKLSEEIKEVLLAQHFSIMCDETKDLSKNEQLSLVLRYLYDGCVYEEFVGFTQANSLDAESLTNYITTNLDKLGLRILDCVSQTYDGASVMSGKLSGVQQRIREIVDSALYVHCYAHRLNLIPRQHSIYTPICRPIWASMW